MSPTQDILPVRGGAGIAYIEFLVEPDTRAQTVEFYKDFLGCETGHFGDKQRGTDVGIVAVGQGVSLLFTGEGVC